jgi:hypothetical protein
MIQPVREAAGTCDEHCSYSYLSGSNLSGSHCSGKFWGLSTAAYYANLADRPDRRRLFVQVYVCGSAI